MAAQWWGKERDKYGGRIVHLEATMDTVPGGGKVDIAIPQMPATPSFFSPCRTRRRTGAAS